VNDKRFILVLVYHSSAVGSKQLTVCSWCIVLIIKLLLQFKTINYFILNALVNHTIEG